MSCRSRRSHLPRSKHLPCALALAALLAAGPAHARPLAEIVEAGVLKICVQEDSPPFSNARPKPSGMLVDVSDAVARELGVKPDYVWLFSSEYIRKTDCDLVPATARIEGDEPLKQTIPYADVRSLLIVKRDHAPVNELASLKDGHIAVLANSYARHLLNAQGYPLWVRFLENDEIIDAVAEGKADAGIVPLYAYQWRVHEKPDLPLRAEKSVALDPSLNYAVSMGLRRSDAAALAKIDGALQKIMESGEMARIFSRYGMTYEKPE